MSTNSRWKILFVFTLFVLVEKLSAQLDQENAILGVFIDPSTLRGPMADAEATVTKAASEASSAMERGSLSVRFLNSLTEVSEEDLFAALTLTRCEDLHHDNVTLATEEGILYVALTTAGCMRLRQKTAITIPLVSGPNDVIQLINDLRERNTLTWNDITLIHDGMLNPQELDMLISSLRMPTDKAPHTTVTLVDTSKIETSSMKMGTLFQSLGPQVGQPKIKHFMVLLPKDEIETMQNMARSMNLVGPNYQWLYVVPDSHSLNYVMNPYVQNMKDGEHLSFAYNMSENAPSSDCRNDYTCYLDSLVREVAQELSLALEEEWKTYQEVSEEEWEEIKPTRKERAAKVAKAMLIQQQTLPSCSVCTQWGIEAVEIKGEDKFQLLSVGDWRPAGGLILFDDIFPHVTGGLRGRVIPVTSVNYPPWQIITKDDRTGTVSYSGLIFEVLNELGRKLNFTFVVLEPEDGLWGTNKGGAWNGMIKMVMDKKVMVGAAAFSVSEERIGVVNFTYTIDRQPYAFMIPRPQELSRVLIFIEPFANDTWLWIGLTTLIMGPILFIIHRLSPYYKFHGLDDGLGLFQLHNCSWYVYGALLQQGGTKLPIAHSGRVMVSFWWIFVIVVVTTYSGNLVAFLTFPQLENSVSTLDHLLGGDFGFTWGFVEGTVLEEYFKNAEEEKFKKLGERAEIHAKEDMELYDKVRYYDHAFLEWKSSLLFTIKREFNRTDTCDFSLGREEFFHENVAMAVPKDSPYLHQFNKEIKKMLEAGINEKWKQDFWPRKDKCSTTVYISDATMRTVSLSDMQGSFILLLLGLVLALVFVLLECICRARSKSLPSTPSSTRTLVKSFVA